MDNLNRNHAAVSELLQEDTPEGFNETLSEFYEAWNASQFCDGTTAEQRSVVLTHYKALRRFLFRLQREGSLASEKEVIEKWIR